MTHSVERLRIDWLTSLDAIESLKDPWVALESKADARTVYVTHDYVAPWYRTYAATHDTDFGTPLVGAVWDGSALVGIAPLISSRSTLARVPVRYLALAGYNFNAGEIFAPDRRAEIVEALLRSLAGRSGWDVLVLANMDMVSEQARAAQEAAGHLGLRCEVAGDHSYALADLQGGYPTYARRRGSNFRKQTRRHAKKVAEAGLHRIDRLPPFPEPAVLSGSLDRMFAIAEAGWRARERGLDAERRHHPFFRTLAERFAPRGMVDLSILSVNGRDAAFSLALVEHGTYFHLMIAYDEAMAALSPGSFLLQEVFRILPDLGVHRVVSHGDYDYKRRWASSIVQQRKILVFARTFRATLSWLAKFRLARVWPAVRGGSARGADPGTVGQDPGRPPDELPAGSASGGSR